MRAVATRGGYGLRPRPSRKPVPILRAMSTSGSRDPERWLTIADEFRARGLRWTPQRRALLAVLADREGHVTGAELIERCRQRDPDDHPLDGVPDARRRWRSSGSVRHGHGPDGREEYHVLPGRQVHGHLHCHACGGDLGDPAGRGGPDRRLARAATGALPWTSRTSRSWGAAGPAAADGSARFRGRRRGAESATRPARGAATAGHDRDARRLRRGAFAARGHRPAGRRGTLRRMTEPTSADRDPALRHDPTVADPPGRLRELLAGVRALVLDVDGVILLAGRPIPGAAEAIRDLDARGIPYRIVTNSGDRQPGGARRALRRPRPADPGRADRDLHLRGRRLHGRAPRRRAALRHRRPRRAARVRRPAPSHRRRGRRSRGPGRRRGHRRRRRRADLPQPRPRLPPGPGRRRAPGHAPHAVVVDEQGADARRRRVRGRRSSAPTGVPRPVLGQARPVLLPRGRRASSPAEIARARRAAAPPRQASRWSATTCTGTSVAARRAGLRGILVLTGATARTTSRPQPGGPPAGRTVPDAIAAVAGRRRRRAGLNRAGSPTRRTRTRSAAASPVTTPAHPDGATPDGRAAQDHLRDAPQRQRGAPRALRGRRSRRPGRGSAPTTGTRVGGAGAATARASRSRSARRSTARSSSARSPGAPARTSGTRSPPPAPRSRPGAPRPGASAWRSCAAPPT